MTTERDVLRELEAALDVSPSPDFEARVRQCVRTQSVRPPRWTWTAGLAAAATIVLAVMLVPERRLPAPHVNAPPARSDAAPMQPDTSLEPSRPVSPSSRIPLTRPSRQVAERPAVDSTPEVIVPSGQMAAIQRLMNEFAKGRVVMAPERPTHSAALEIAAIEPPSPITFAPIAFKPLSPESSPELWR